MTKRIIAMLLVLCTLSLCLVSCGGGKTPDVTNAPFQGNQGSQSNEPSKWDDVSFKGTTLYVGLNNVVNSNITAAGAEHSNKFLVGPDNYTTDAVQNAVYERNTLVKDTLGLDIIYTYYENSNSESVGIIDGWVLAATDDTPDIVTAMSYTVVRSALSGSLRNVLGQEEKNYFDFTDSHWYNDYMKATSLSNDKLYMLASDYYIDTYRMAFVTLANNDLYNEIFANEGGIESLYETIEAGNWTYDELKRTAARAHVDAGTVGQQDEADTFGVTGTHSMATRSLFFASGLDIFNYDANGNPVYTEDITALHNYTDEILNMFNQSYVYLPPSGKKALDTQQFINGGALYALGQYMVMLEGATIQNMGSGQAVSVIPTPKYSKDAEYQSLVSDNAAGGAILMSTTDFTAATAFIQMMTEESGEIFKQYYEVALKYKLSSGSGQVKILDIIKNSVTASTAFLYDNYCARTLGTSTEFRTIYDILGESVTGKTNTLTSTWNSQLGAMQQQLANTVTKFNALD